MTEEEITRKETDKRVKSFNTLTIKQNSRVAPRGQYDGEKKMAMSKMSMVLQPNTPGGCPPTVY